MIIIISLISVISILFISVKLLFTFGAICLASRSGLRVRAYLCRDLTLEAFIVIIDRHLLYGIIFGSWECTRISGYGG